MDLPKKSRKWRLKKVNKIGPHSSKYQKDYQKKPNTPSKTNINGHRATYTHRYRTHIHISTARTHTNTQHSSMQHLAMDARTWPSVTPGGHSVRHTEVVPTFDTEPTNHTNGGKHGSEPIPIGFAISKHNKKRCDCGDDRHSSNTFSTLDTNSTGSTKIPCYT